MFDRFWKWRYEHYLREYARLVEYKKRFGATIGPSENAFIEQQLYLLGCKVQQIYKNHGPYEDRKQS